MFENLSRFIIKWYKWIFGFSIVGFVGVLFIAMNIGMDSNMEGLLPTNSESLRATKEYNQFFDSQDHVLIVVKGEAKQCEPFLEALGSKLQEEKTVNNVLYKMDMSEVEQYLPLYMDTSAYEKLGEELNDQSSPMFQFLQKKDLISLTKLFTYRLENAHQEQKEKLLTLFSKLLEGKMKLTEEEQKNLFSALLFGEIKQSTNQSQYIVSDSKKAYLMIVKPNMGMDTFIEDRTVFFDRLESSIEEIKKSSGNTVEVGITGGAFVQDYEADNSMFNGFLSTAILTFGIIILFIVLSFKRLLLPVATGFPLLLGAMLATAFAYLVYRNLNMFSISFAVLLLGLGIDFGVHILSRYLEERENGKEVQEAVAITIKETSSSMIIGAITTTIAFFSFLTAEFRAFTQMGVISGAGILLLCVTMIFIMPTLILLFDHRKGVRKAVKSSGYEFLKPVGRAIEKRPMIFILVIGIGAVSLLGNVQKVDVKTDMSKIYPQNMECLTWLAVVEEEFDYNPTTLLFMVDDLEQLESAISKLNTREDIKKVSSIIEYLPEDQGYKLEVIRRWNTGLQQTPLERTQSSSEEVIEVFADLKEACDKASIDQQGEGYQVVEKLYRGLRSEKAVEILQSMAEKQALLKDTVWDQLLLNEETLTVELLPENLRSNYVGKEGKLTAEVAPKVNIWDTENYATIASGIKEASGRNPVGLPAIMNEITGYVKKDILRISIFCFAALFLILLIMFRSAKDAGIIISTLGLTIFITLGIMPIVGIDLNIFSIIALPVLIGIGVDSGVHLLHRIKNSPDQDIAYILCYTGKAIMMTTITTLIGFGSLYFTNHPGLSSFGLVTVVGMILCLILTMTLLPSMYVVLYSKENNKKIDRTV